MKPTALGYITLDYGVKRDYWISPTHTGIDWRAYTGTPVFACQPGRVLHSGYGGWGSSYGNHVIIEMKTPFSRVTRRVIYAHLSRNSVYVGQSIGKGQKVGEAGGTGNVTAPHLHLEQRHYPYGYWDNEYPSVVNDRIQPREIIRHVILMRNVRKERKKAVSRIQRALNREYPGREIKVTGKWNKDTKRLYAFHQRKLGFKGSDADGQPGRESLRKLGFKIK